MTKKFTYLLSLAFAVLVMAGCKSESGTNASTPAGGTTVDLAADEAAMDVVRTKLDSLGGQRPAVIAQTMLAYIKKLPQFKASWISDDGSVWAEFQDGILYTIGTNDPDLNVQTTPAKSVAPSRTPGLPKSAVASGEVPGSATAYVFNALEANRGIPDDKIAQQLTAAGYTVVRGTGSLTEWKNVTNAGILFSASHGDRLTYEGVTAYYMQSSTPYVKGDKTYIADLISRRLVVSEIAIDDEPLVRGKTPQNHHEPRYLFKAEFLPTSRMFADNGFMFNAACSGTHSLGLAFAQSLKANNNLSVYGGWSEPVYHPDDIESILFFFDRVLGINQFAPVDASKPPPADWATAVSAMGSNARASGNGTNLTVSDPHIYFPDYQEPKAVFSIQNLSGGNLTTLVPSVTDATTDAVNSSLVFTGSFGTLPGRVSVDGTDVTLKTWTPGKITTAFPKASGKAVIISSTGLSSNKVPVTVTSNVTLAPKGGGYFPSDEFLVVASPRSGNGITYSYHWKLAGSTLANMQDLSAAHTGMEFTSTDGTVRVATTPSTQGTLTVSCTVTTVVAGVSTLVGAASAEFAVYPFSNKILFQSGTFQSNSNVHKYFAYVLLKKDPLKTVAPIIRCSTYVNGTLRAVSNAKGTLMTKVYDISTYGEPVGGPQTVPGFSTKDYQLMLPPDETFTYQDVPEPVDLGDAIAIIVSYSSVNVFYYPNDEAKIIAAVNARAAMTQIAAGLIYP